MSKKILIVEDIEDNRKLLRDLLGAEGYTLIEAQDGPTPYSLTPPPHAVCSIAEVEPDGLLDDLGWTALAAVDDLLHPVCYRTIREAATCRAT